MLVSDPQTIETYYRALVERKPDFVGTFYVGVKTTSIFCISTCRARKPKLKNVEFYTSLKEVMEQGYRPCKVCKPTQNGNEMPGPVVRAIRLVKADPKAKISDRVLQSNGISPDLVRRWFKKNYGLTFHAYQRMFRINTAYQEIREGKNATLTAFDNGYESLSGFGYTFKKLVGKSPQNSAEQNMILMNRVPTPIGPMFICATERGICLLEFVDRPALETELKDLQSLLEARIIAGENEHTRQARRELSEYFEGRRQQFEVAMDLPGTDFQKAAWEALLGLPFGTQSTYARQAQAIGNPKAVRAIGAANGANRVAIMVPCHRVVGTNGQLTGYGGGIQRKRWLLLHEEQHLAKHEHIEKGN